jgi:hypothetical protein
VQFAHVQLGLPQLRAASPQPQFTQVHGSQVHAGFSQVVAVPMTRSSLACTLARSLSAHHRRAFIGQF